MHSQEDADHMSRHSISSRTQGNIPSSYSAKLDQGTGQFSVIESNRFKQLTHITLILRAGNDSAIKSYLASRLSISLNSERKLDRELSVCREELKVEQSMIQNLSEEILQLRTHKDVDMQSIRALHAQELSQQQMNSSETLEATRHSLVAQIEALRSQSQRVQDDHMNQIGKLESSWLDEKQVRSQYEFKVKELTRSLEVCENDRDRLLNESRETGQSLRDSEMSKALLERDIVRLQSKVEALSEQLGDKDVAIQRSSDLQQASESSKEALEEQLALYKNGLEVMQEKLLSAVAEIKKGNHVISKLQQDVQMLRERAGSKSEVLYCTILYSV